MISEDIIMVVCADVANQVRGKGFPASERETRVLRGVGWVPTNSLITCFNTIADGPFGSLGDLLLIPDERAEVRVAFDDGSAPEHFMLGDIRTLDGAPWNCCPRSILQDALADLLSEAGVQLKVAFEHEFWSVADEAVPWSSFSLGNFRHGAEFGRTLLAALRSACLTPDTFLPEYGQDQYEVTVAPSLGLRAADECIIVREMVRAVAKRTGRKVSFSPVVNAGTGNGLHIHISLVDRAGVPCTYDATSPARLTPVAGSFFGGIRKYLPSLLALTASSVVSYERLQPHRWSAAFNNLAENDREAALRLCPGDWTRRVHRRVTIPPGISSRRRHRQPLCATGRSGQSRLTRHSRQGTATNPNDWRPQPADERPTGENRCCQITVRLAVCPRPAR